MASKKGKLAESGKPQKHVGANRYAGELKDIFSIQDEITMNIIHGPSRQVGRRRTSRTKNRGIDLLGWTWGTSGTYFGDMEGGIKRIGTYSNMRLFLDIS